MLLASVAFGSMIGSQAATSFAGQVTTLFSFNGANGSSPQAGLILGKRGVLYGTTYGGGSTGAGTVFSLTPPAAGGAPWTERVLYKFAGTKDGANPQAGLVRDKTGVLYGTTVKGGSSGVGVVFSLAPPPAGQTRWKRKILFSFGGTHGSSPYAGLIRDKDGVLYGTTFQGGDFGTGTVFSLTPPPPGKAKWKEKVLYSFYTSGPGDGTYPAAGLIRDDDGTLFGTTVGGGDAGLGTVFSVVPPKPGKSKWTEKTLYAFKAGQGDGAYPYSDLTRGENGVLYGTTTNGGASDDGVVFSLTPPTAGQSQWTEKVLYSFKGTPDAAFPLAGLTPDNSGTLFGTTNGGGLSNLGALFSLVPPQAGQTDWTEHVLHSFTGSSGDGARTHAGLLEADDGTLYGTTLAGGDSTKGTVFKLVP